MRWPENYCEFFTHPSLNFSNLEYAKMIQDDEKKSSRGFIGEDFGNKSDEARNFYSIESNDAPPCANIQISSKGQTFEIFKIDMLNRFRGFWPLFFQFISVFLAVLIFGIGWNIGVAYFESNSYSDQIYANRTRTFSSAKNLQTKSFMSSTRFHSNISSASEIFSLFTSDGPIPIPSLDTFVQIGIKLREAFWNKTQDREIEKSDSALYLRNLINTGKIYFIPDDTNTRSLLDYLDRTSIYFKDFCGGVFNSTTEVNDKILTGNHSNYHLWALVEFHSLSFNPGRIEYTIRMNQSTIPETSTLSSPWGYGYDPTYKLYITSGFLTIQQEIERFILQAAENYTKKGKSIPRNVQNSAFFVQSPFPIRAYVEPSGIFEAIGPLSGLFLTLTISISFASTVNELVEFKSKGLLNLFSVMGMNLRCWLIAKGISMLIIQFFTAAVVSVIISNLIIIHTSFLIIFIFLFAFLLTLIPLALIFFALVKSTKVAVVLAPLSLFFMVLPRYAFFNNTRGDSNVAMKYITCLFSPSALAFGTDTLMSNESSDVSISWDSLKIQVGIFSFGSIVSMLLVDSVLYSIIFMSCIAFQTTWKKTCSTHSIKKLHNSEQKNQSGEYVEKIQQDKSNKAAICFDNISKNFDSLFGTKIEALKNMSFDFFTGEIYALLGHNSSGKTTSISIMTGSILPSSGDCYINEQNTRTEIPSGIGFCPQENIHVENLTVEEHLKFGAKLKGVPSYLIKVEATKYIDALDLIRFRKTLCKNLSGGNKRKLSVALAFIGNSKIIILDEPTSSMDPLIRKKTWKLIKSRKNHCCIVCNPNIFL